MIKYTKLYDLGIQNSTPLWFYILAEADVCEGGVRLGPMAGRIVAEVIIECIRRSKHSVINKDVDCPKVLVCHKYFTVCKLIEYVNS